VSRVDDRENGIVAEIAVRKPEPGRCIFCDQRCDVTAFFHGYCLELQHQPSAPSLLSRLLLESVKPAPAVIDTRQTFDLTYDDSDDRVVPSQR